MSINSHDNPQRESSVNSESEQLGLTQSPPAFQLMADGETGDLPGSGPNRSSMAPPPFQLQASPIQRIPRSPEATPFEGKIIPWSTPLRETPNLEGRRLVDVPKDHPVQVLSGDSWLLCTTRIAEVDYEGYISHEQIKREQSFTNTTDTGNDYASLLTMFNRTFAITKEVNFVDDGNFATDGDYEALRSRTINAIQSYLSRKYKVKIISADNEQPGDGEYPITVGVTHNSAADYSVTMHGAAAGSSQMATGGGHIYEQGQPGEGTIPDITLAHEGSHMVLGASDEYANAAVAARVLTNDHSLMANYYNQGVDEAEIKVRHFGFLVDLVSNWFPGRNISIVE
jgi:hypothetical protein